MARLSYFGRINMIMQVSICLKLIYVVMPLHVSRKIIVGEYSRILCRMENF